MKPSIFRIAIVYSHVLFRKTLVHFLNRQRAIEVEVHAGSIGEAMERLNWHSIDFLLIDTGIVGKDAMLKEELIGIKNGFPNLRIIGLSMCCAKEPAGGAAFDLFDGFIYQSDEPDKLLRMIGGSLIWEEMQGSFGRTVHARRAAALNDREKRVLEMIWEGKSNKEIAGCLFLGSRSIEKMRRDMKEKLEVRSTIGLLKYGIAAGIIRFNTRPAR